MSTIGYRNRFYQARHTWPQPDSSKACPQAANELRAAKNEQSPPPCRLTPDPQIRYPSSKHQASKSSVSASRTA